MVRRRWSVRSGSRAWIAGLGLAGILLLGLILRDTIFSSAQTATTPRLATVTRGTVQSQVSGTGSLVPSAKHNLGFRTAGQLTAVDVRVGQTVKAGQVLARIDPSAAQASLAQAQASLQSAQAGLQSANAPLTAAQRLQLQHQLSAAQQNYHDTVASVNQTNQADATAVANDQAKVSADGPAGAQCSADKAQLASDQQRQKTDQVSGNSRIHQAQQQINSASDNLAIQSQVKSQAVSSAQAQVASAQAQVTSAQQAVSQTTLTAPANGVVISINGVPGEYVGTGGGTTAEAPGSLAPAPSTSSASGSGSSSAFMVIQDTSSFVSVVPFAETDAAKLQAQQPASAPPRGRAAEACSLEAGEELAGDLPRGSDQGLPHRLGRGPGTARNQRPGRRGRVRRHHGAVWVRQEHLDEPDRMPRHPYGRPLRARRSRGRLTLG